MNKIKIKKGDQVMVITGEYKGTKGTVLKVLYNSNKALVEGVNTVKRHTKPNSENPKGGITEKQLPINISNISLIILGPGSSLMTSYPIVFRALKHSLPLSILTSLSGDDPPISKRTLSF